MYHVFDRVLGEARHTSEGSKAARLQVCGEQLLAGRAFVHHTVETDRRVLQPEGRGGRRCRAMRGVCAHRRASRRPIEGVVQEPSAIRVDVGEEFVELEAHETPLVAEFDEHPSGFVAEALHHFRPLDHHDHFATVT